MPPRLSGAQESLETPAEQDSFLPQFIIAKGTFLIWKPCAALFLPDPVPGL